MGRTRDMAKLEKAFGLDWEGDKETLRRSGSKTSPALREKNELALCRRDGPGPAVLIEGAGFGLPLCTPC